LNQTIITSILTVVVQKYHQACFGIHSLLLSCRAKQFVNDLLPRGDINVDEQAYAVALGDEVIAKD